MISTAFSPNTQKDDLWLVISLLLRPWKWFGGKDVRQFEQDMADYTEQPVVAFDSGRSSLYALLKTFGIGSGDEVLLQAFTCVALPNPILWADASPVYVDVDKTNFNIDISDLEQKITKKSKAVIVQFTFGICPDIKKIKELCRKHNLILIEDCCHNLGQVYKIDGKEYMAGGYGDAAIYSIGMEKVISSTRGGFASINVQYANSSGPDKNRKENKNLLDITGKSYDELVNDLRDFQSGIQKPRFRDILRGLFNPIVWTIRKNWGSLGNLIFKLMVKIKLHELGLTKLELVGKKASWLPYSMPNANAVMGNHQLKKIYFLNEHRRNVVDKYYENVDKSKNTVVDEKRANEFAHCNWLRFPVIRDDAHKLIKELEKENIYLGNWYTSVIHSKNVDLEALGYKKGSCPNAEWLSQNTLNLPTHVGIGNEDVEVVIRRMNE